MRKLALTLQIAMLSSIVSCGGGGSTSFPAPTAADVMEVSFARIAQAGLDDVRVTAHLSQEGQPVLGAQPTYSSDRGSVSALIERGAGDYEFVVTPTQTGEHQITVEFAGQSIVRTALVFADVAAGWGQPMAVEGLVNTPGYEDGITVTPDGQYLFVQYGPWRFSALYLYEAPRSSGGAGGHRLLPSRFSHPWVDTTIGPTAAPERPGLFNGRFMNGQLLHNSNLWGLGIDQAPNFAPITMFYGFRRQADGSYAEPFYVAFDDANDGIMNPFGLSFRMNSASQATILFALDDPSDPNNIDKNSDGSFDVDSRFDVFTYELTLGVNSLLGAYQIGSPPTPGNPYPSTLVDFGRTGTTGNYGTQGNPHLHALSDGTVKAIFTDDEYDDSDADPDNDSDHGDLSAYVITSGSFPGGNWTKVVLPSKVNTSAQQIQPFFTGSELYFADDVSIRYSAFTGTDTVADYGDDSKWSASSVVLGKDTSAIALGKVIAIGEPTIATIDGVEYLYFVYVWVRGFDATSGFPDLDMQAGFVPRN